MSFKSAMLVTCAVIATATVVRSNPEAAPAATPTPLTGVAVAPAGSATDATGETPGKVVGHAGTPDLGALYYFVSQHNAARVAAEIKLLKARNPDWQPPEDLFTAAVGVDEQPLWDLFAKRDFAGVRASVAQMTRDKPGWRLSGDLAAKLAFAEASDALVKASDAKQWPAVVDVASGNATLLTCANIDALWRTAEALARTGDEPRALAAYRYALTNCDTPPERLATAQKASLVLSSADSLDELLKLERRGPDGRGEFEQIRLDRVRRSVGDAMSDPASKAALQADLDAVAANAGTAAGQADAELLGWYGYTRSDYPAAQRWFKTALADGASPKAAEGLVLALRDGNLVDEARRTAVRYAGLDPQNRKLMVDVFATSLTDPNVPAPTPEQMATFTQAVNDFKSQDGAEALRWSADHRHDAAGTKAWSAKWVAWKGEEVEGIKSAEGAEALGWQLYQNNDVTGAETWFRKSADWSPSESAAIGLILTARRLHHEGDFKKWVATYRGTYPQIAKLEKSMGSGVLPKRVAKLARVLKVARVKTPTRPTGDNWDRSANEIVKVFRDGHYDQAIALMDKRRLTRKEPSGLAVIRGWAQFHHGDWAEAEKTFAGLDAKSSDQKEQGLRLIRWSYTNPRYR